VQLVLGIKTLEATILSRQLVLELALDRCRNVDLPDWWIINRSGFDAGFDDGFS